MTFRQLADWVVKTRTAKGFYTPSTISATTPVKGLTAADAALGKLMLVTTEISEAAEAVREQNVPMFAEELADAAIRIVDLAHSTGIDLQAEMEKKMQKNEQRPTRHGKATSL